MRVLAYQPFPKHLSSVSQVLPSAIFHIQSKMSYLCNHNSLTSFLHRQESLLSAEPNYKWMEDQYQNQMPVSSKEVASNPEVKESCFSPALSVWCALCLDQDFCLPWHFSVPVFFWHHWPLLKSLFLKLPIMLCIKSRPCPCSDFSSYLPVTHLDVIYRIL